MSNPSYYRKLFKDISTTELHRILGARMAVFVVEQTCPYQDIDGKDPDGLHLWIEDEGCLVAYSRILPPGSEYTDASFGRLLVVKERRGANWGNAILEFTMEVIEDEFGKVPVKIGAQTYLQEWYEKKGFVVKGGEYLEDGIPHKDMMWSP